jgi:CcmD family protein
MGTFILVHTLAWSTIVGYAVLIAARRRQLQRQLDSLKASRGTSPCKMEEKPAA